ncbi:DciA family protein [Streptomyces olivaceoviridis]|uniref:DciA family protein n=1 Tax=Streptomyces olivaceoviridis TaxID=1921 RepID=UPI0036C66C4F
MTETPQLSGKDLARQALAAYKATARTAPAPGPARPKRKRVTRHSGGRDPITLATAITALGADLPLDTGIAGGNLLNQWPELCPQFAGRVEPAAYDEQTGRLDLRPASHAYAAQLRLLGGQLAKQINDKLGRPIVRSIRVLPVGSVRGTEPTSMPPSEATGTNQTPVKTRDTASTGYRHVLALALENKPSPTSANPYEEEARQRQIAAARANRLPETEHTEAQWAQDEAERKAGPRPGSLEASIAAAIARKRQEAAGLTEPRRAFDVA